MFLVSLVFICRLLKDISFRYLIIPACFPNFCQIGSISSEVQHLTEILLTESGRAKLLHVSSNSHFSLYTLLWCSFFHHSMVLTHVQSVIQIPLALVGRTAIKLAFLNMYFHSWSHQTNAECLPFFYWVISTCILHAKWLISFVANLHSADLLSLMPVSSMFFIYWILSGNLEDPQS